MSISKSKYIAGVQCLKRLYLLVHEPQVAVQPEGANEAIIEQGRQVGLLARQLFPGGIEVSGSRLTLSRNFKNIEFEEKMTRKQISRARWTN
jgi:hypothetical protein